MKTNRILITGGDGFLGKRLLNKLKELGYESISYDISKSEDINNYDQLKKACLDFRPNILIHLAAVSNLNFYNKDLELSRKINIQGTRNVLNICNELLIRMIFASTCCIYGNNNCLLSDEDSITCPTEPYAESKKESEEDILKANNDLGHTILRLATFYGPQMRKELAPAIFIAKTHNEDKIEIHGNGQQIRSMTYVDDIISGIILVATSEFKYRIINVTTSESVSVNEMLKIVQKIIGKNSEIVHVDDRPGQIYYQNISNQRLKSMGWQPKYNFYDGIKESFDFYLKNNHEF